LKIEKEEIEKEMIAGYKLYSKDKIVDASLNTLLKKFTK
jgi:F0F1-type ATP synthase delta subunit